jgi:hypothetical protein
MKSKQLFFENLIAQNALGGIPVDYNFAGKTLYQIFEDLFSGGNNFTTISLEDNAGLEFNLLSQLRTKYNTLIPDNVDSQPINRLSPKPASVWKTKTIVQVLDDILFPASLATYTPPTILLRGSLTAPYYETGSLQTNNLSLAGVKNDAGIYTNLSISRGGSQIASVSNPSGATEPSQPQGSSYPNPNLPNLKYTLNHSDVNFQVIQGINTWSGVGSYNQGLAKQNSDNTTDARPFLERTSTNPQLGDNSFDSNNVTIEGIYPIFYGVSDTKLTSTQMRDIIEAGNANKALVKANGAISITFDAQDKFIWFAHAGPGVYPNKTKWFVTSGNKGDILGASDLFSSPVSIIVKSPNSNSGTPYWQLPYSTYISNYATRTRKNESEGNIMQLQN